MNCVIQIRGPRRYSSDTPRESARLAGEERGERHGNVADRRARDPPNYRQSSERERTRRLLAFLSLSTIALRMASSSGRRCAPGEELASVDRTTKRMRAEYNEAPRRGGCGNERD